MWTILPLLFLTLPQQKLNSEFIRIQYDKKQPVILQIAVRSYTNDKNQKVDLVGVVHVADKLYYEQLNKLFKNYDAVCYELVADKHTKVHPSSSFLKTLLKTFMNLDHQLDVVDYNAKNFVHADVSPEQLLLIMQKSEGNLFTLFMKVLSEQMKTEGTEFDFSNPFALKRIFAESLVKSNIGPTLEKLLIVERNKVAMEEVVNQLKTKNNVAIFYGAAHMPDFDSRLKDLGFKYKESIWLNAWDLLPSAEEKLFELLKQLMQEK